MNEPKYAIVKSKQFKKSYKLAKRQGKDLATLAWGINQLAYDIPLPPNWKDHELKGNYKGIRECHIGGIGDWLLVYEIRECHIGGIGDWLLVYEKCNNDMVLYLIGTESHEDMLGI